jgi:hypothetical protein
MKQIPTRTCLTVLVVMAILIVGLATTTPSKNTPDEMTSAREPSTEGLSQGNSANWDSSTTGPKAALTGNDFAREGSGSNGKDISFKWPIDFATGANPSSAAFNAAAGEQFPHLYQSRSTLSDSLGVGDFNRDGKPDVAQTNVIAGSVSVFLGDGRGGFKPPDLYDVGVNPHFVVAGHLDLDRHLDLAVADFGSSDVAILLGDGDGSFQPARFFSVPAPRNVAIGNFNDDGIPDLAVASNAPAAGPSPSVRGVAILTGSKEGNGTTFSPAQFIVPTGNNTQATVNYVAVGDLNGSGVDDLAVGVGYSPSAGDQQANDTKLTGDDVLIFLNNDRSATIPGQPFDMTPDQDPIRVGAIPNGIAVADLNGDANPDLAVIDNGIGNGDVTTLLGDGRGHFEVKDRNVTLGGSPRAFALADFDADGIADLVTANFFSSTVSVLRGNGDGTFQPAVDFWSGDATTGVAVGDFNDDGRVDVVAGRLRNDHLALLLNDSPQRGDGVVIDRDISYGSPTHPTNDPYAAHHTLDVYSPPKGTTSFAGSGQRYPIVLFAHGGAGITGDKSQVSLLMRSLALEGIVAVSTNYRLVGGQLDHQTRDVAQAFRWTYDNVGSRTYGGDPNNMFVVGTSAGALVHRLGTESKWLEEQGLDYQRHIRGMVVAGGIPLTAPSPSQRPQLLLAGSEGLETAMGPAAKAYSEASANLGAESYHETIAGRDHLTIVSRMALVGDEARVFMLNFMQKHITR